VALLDDQNQSDGAILVFHDLTRVKQLEGARQEFVANVSHELRTPLTLIKGCVETLLDGAKDDPAVRDRFLQTIEKHADRLTYLIEDLLTLSQLESGRLALNLRATQLREVGLRVIDSLEARARLKEVTLENQIPADLFAQADGERLEQVLFNLVDNAIKYGRSGGRVVLQGEHLADSRARISVQDDGPGIPPEARERVFERFYRLDKARSREQGGTGLGLAIVKHIIQRHGGEVGVQSEVGQGSTFFFTLPAKVR
jgi:two-component system phosphate regulon sensor histidine kinase PhoR